MHPASEGATAVLDWNKNYGDEENKLTKLARGGFKRRTVICDGHYKEVLKKAFTSYLGYDWADIN